MNSQDEARELLLHLEVRKRVRPLDFFRRLRFQDLFNKSQAKIKGLFGGNRSGKTEEGAEYIIERCRKTKLRVWACALTYQDSIQIQQRKVWDLLPKDEVRYAHYDEVNGFRNNVVIFNNGSNITFKSYEQGAAKFQGNDIDIIWNDEEPPFDIYKEQRMRLIDRDGEMIFTMTSLHGLTELMHDLYEDADILQTEHAPLVDEELPRIVQKNGAIFYMLWSTENPYVNQARLADDVRLMSKQEIKQRIYGIPINLSGRIYPSFNKKIHVVPQSAIPKRRVTIYMVLDPHDRKPWAMTWWAVDRTGSAYCIREYPWRKNFNEMDFDDKTFEDYKQVINNTEKDISLEYGRSVSRRIIDPNFGTKTVKLSYRVDNQAHTTPQKELQRLGFTFHDGIDALEAGHLQVRKWLHWAEKDGQIIVQPKIFFSEECENTIRHMSRYSRKDIETSDGDVKDKPGIQDKYKDFPDTVRYFLMSNPHFIERVTQAPEPTGKVY